MATLLFSFGGLFQVSVLLINSLAVLSEDRFLARIGWGSSQQQQQFEPSFGGGGGMQDPTSLSAKMSNLINSVRTLMRIPLIFLNVLIIIWAVAFG
ncbi:Yos1-like protein [Sphaerulina musiva SO2202]|uniref:Yos1-like protein n=1 Tax=Sphaerulina musiva (strain SO2202) TaxID=692275 RepID=M3CJC3_SPHMS|nr:Yos1-like protein [Sphaerulina musiva SO2202]EMF13893.1 Yos1-like protein [Sphaerulina musiva SO2202]